MDPHKLFSLNDHLKALNQIGEPIEVLERTADFEHFRSCVVEGLEFMIRARLSWMRFLGF